MKKKSVYIIAGPNGSGKTTFAKTFLPEYAGEGVDFAFETTMSGVTYLKYFKMLREKGYRLNIFFLWIPGARLAIARVKDRVEQCGHHVPKVDIKRRFKRSIEKFFKDYRLLADKWILFDNAETIPRIIARQQNARIEVMDAKLYQFH